MEYLPKNPILQFNSDTLQAVRKLYNLDQPGRMEEAINILEEWLKKQDHFVKKDFSRDFLERLIIMNKGLLERVKSRLDKTCTLRTLMPHFFGCYNPKYDFEELQVMKEAVLPNLTPDNYRVYLNKNTGKREFSTTFFLNFYRRLIICWEYLLKHDYSTGLVVILDFTEVNLVDVIAKMGITELRQFLSLFLEGYGTRVKGMHIITTSKVIDTLVAIFKQVFSAKIAGRIHTYTNVEALYNIIPRDILPADYGGKEKSLSEIHDKWLEILSTDEHMEYMKTVNAAKTDESRRTVEKFNEQYLGTPGTFRTMVVD